MTLLNVANTPADFIADGSDENLSYNTTTLHRDSSYVPNDIMTEVKAGQGNPFSIINDAEYTDFWIHFRHRTANLVYGSVDGILLSFKDSNEDIIARLDWIDDAIRIQAVGDTTVSGSQYELPSFTSVTIDVHIELTGGNIVATYYHNGSQLSQATAANTGGKGGVKSVVFDQLDVTYNTQNTYYSEIILTDGEPTLGWRLACMVPDTDGDHTDFVGGADKIGDSDIITAAGASNDGDRLSSNLTAYGGPTTPASIRAVVAKCVVSKGDTGPQHMRQFLRISATDYDGSQAALSVDTANYMEEWATNPATAAPWDTSDLTGLQVGIKAET